jgi:cobaltochelatase CobS
MTHKENAQLPDITVSVREMFGVETDWEVPAYKEPGEHVPAVDPDYCFDPATTLCVLAGFAHDLRVLISGFHGTGKSSHIEQVAARLNWPCVRVNFDGHVSRLDLVGKDAIVLRDGRQVTEFRDGILPWAYVRNTALVFDEYDAGRPEVMFVVQQVLETEGRLTLLDQNRVLRPHPAFRLFATANTVGLGDATGLYHGTQQVNQSQMDRWTVVANLGYLPHDDEVRIVLSKLPSHRCETGAATVGRMVALANLTRNAFANGELSTMMSPRTLINLARNAAIFGSTDIAFRLSFLNRCDESEQALVAEFYQRCFGRELAESAFHRLTGSPAG